MLAIAQRQPIATGDRQILLAIWHCTCAYCRSHLSQGDEHFDHITPITRGGRHALDNLTVACPPCNLSKRTRTAAEFGHPNVPRRALAHRNCIVDHLNELLAGSQTDRWRANQWLKCSPLTRAALAEPF